MAVCVSVSVCGRVFVYEAHNTSDYKPVVKQVLHRARQECWHGTRTFTLSPLTGIVPPRPTTPSGRHVACTANICSIQFLLYYTGVGVGGEGVKGESSSSVCRMFCELLALADPFSN